MNRHIASAPDLASVRDGGRLEVRGLRRSFGGVVALDGVSLEAQPGQVTALIGPNGAGKTTLFDCVTGAIAPDAGQVALDGRELTGLAAHRRVRAGLARTFQRIEVFPGMTVFDNLRVAAESRTPVDPLRALLDLRHPEDRAVLEEVTATLELVGLAAVAGQRAGTLSTGALRLVELGRALCTRPRVLLLDEPGSGLDSAESEQLARLLTGLAASGLTVLLVEHDVALVLRVSAVVHVLEFGRLIASGSPDEVAADPQVRRAYLGVGR